jgi:hypothetical protein
MHARARACQPVSQLLADHDQINIRDKQMLFLSVHDIQYLGMKNKKTMA